MKCILSLAAGLLLATSGVALAHGGAHATPTSHAQTQQQHQQQTQLSPHHATGQPGAECGSATAPNTPGNSASAPGSAFNPDGRAGQVYAGEQPQNSRNTASVSQYDAACAHQP
jgi:hypothetical protein